MRRLLKAALYGGLVAGTLDIGAACLINGVGPAPVLRYIASGLLGRAGVMNRGPEIQALGLALQWAMSILIAAIYAFAAERLPALTRRWIAMGLAYGVGVFVVMTFVVQPLSAAPKAARASMQALSENFIAMLLFGLIVAAATRQVFRGRTWRPNQTRSARTGNEKRRSPRGLRRSCPSIITSGPRLSGLQLHRSVHPLDSVARVAMSLRASLYNIPVSTRLRTTNLATHQRAQSRDRTNV